MIKTIKKYSLGKKSLFFLLLALFFISASLIYEREVYKKQSPENITDAFQKTFLQADNLLASYIDSLSQPVYQDNNSEIDLFSKQNINTSFFFFFFKYQNDSLTYWSDHSVPMPEDFDSAFINGKIIVLANGIYFYKDYIAGNIRTAGMFLIKQNYPYQNIYLENRFQKAFDIPSETEIILEKGESNISTADGTFICSLNISSENKMGSGQSLVLLLLYALAFLSLTVFLYHLCLKYKTFLRTDLLLVLSFSLGVIILRGFMFVFKIPSGLYNSTIFKPESFAVSDYIPSIGDFFFNALALLAISYVLFVTFKNIGLSRRKPPFRRYFLLYSLFSHIYIFYRLFLWAAKSLIMDATYSMNLNQIFFLSSDSLLALVIFTILLFSFFLVSYRILGLAMHHSEKSAFKYFSFFLTISFLYFLIAARPTTI